MIWMLLAGLAIATWAMVNRYEVVECGSRTARGVSVTSCLVLDRWTGGVVTTSARRGL